MSMHSLLRGLFGLALAMLVFAQTRPPSAGPGTPNVPPSPGPTRTSPNFPGTYPDGSAPGQVTTPLFLSGKVVLEDGTPPPDQVAVQIVCRATPRTIAYTDRKGNFNVDLNDRNNPARFQDASENNPVFGGGQFGNGSPRAGSLGRELAGCDLMASLPGFRSDVFHLDARRSLDNPDVGTLFLHRLSNVEGLTISATSALAPKDAAKAFDKGREDERKQKWQDAQKELTKAVSLYPKYAAAWYELGNVQREQKDVAGARESYAKSLEADAKFVSPYLPLAELAGHEQKWQEAADDSDRLLRLNPIDFPDAWLLNAIANFNLGKLDVAEKSAREGLSHDTDHHLPRINLLLGVLLARRQDYSGSAANLKDYLHYAPNAADAEQVKKQLEQVENALATEPKQP